MTDTIPDYAGLIEELRELAKSCGYEYGTESGTTAWNAAAAIRTLLERNKELERERDQLRDKLHCMCGSPIDHSAWEGHTPVSVYDYSLDQERSRAEAAEAALAEKDKALKLAEFMMTKNSLCKDERLEEGLAVIRRALNAGGPDDND